MSRLFAVGDIHGCFDKLVSLLKKIDLDFDRDTLVFMGDYIDRGNESFEVVDFLADLKEKHERIVFLKGNHEDMLLRYLEGPDRYTYIVNGGQPTLESYLRKSKSNEPPIPAKHLDFFKSLEPYFETDDFIFVHAGLRVGVPLDEQEEDDLLWIREGFIDSVYDFGKRVVFGHTPFPEPLIHSNKIGIDTGAVYGNVLSCIRLPDLKIFQSS